ncbi:protein of unknown function [Chitinophaga jiangningensis]|uniref:Peptidase C1A papain C-terminal domain-containing protein n=1 Tax=Chitinophaga jiangningensis TaxID=1419482 RepID=A0A1M7LAK0_9BACT|nr:C1 family peptidase [Chitinophaga jiangningensis]SHM75010.1 protein of unknown function [Chitinophaga jiangningensis]
MKYAALLFILCSFVCIKQLHSQNIVIAVKGNITLQNSQPVKKGDNIKNNAVLLFRPDGMVSPEVKLLSPKGVCVIRYRDYEQRPKSELLQLVAATIHKNSVATLGTREYSTDPGPQQQVQLVDSLCRLLGANAGNISGLVFTYINPYCVATFTSPYWTEIGDMLQAKYGYQVNTSTGNTLTAAAFDAIPKMAQVKTREYLPNAASLKKYCPIPGDQGHFGTCTGWSAAYGTRTISWAIRNNLTATSDITNQAFSPTFVYEQIKDNDDVNCSRGSSITRAVQLMKTSGVPFLSDLSFSCNADLQPYRSAALNYTIKDFQALNERYGIAATDEEFQKTLTNIKTAISQKKPILAAIDCYGTFKGKVWNGVADKNMGGHAICIIGYDDSFSNGEGAVEILNSWSPFWGNGGFIHVKYADLRRILRGAISVYDDVKPQPLIPADIKKDTIPVIVTDTLKRLTGSFSLVLANGNHMKAIRNESGVRGLRLTNIDEMTYNIAEAYPSNTNFRLQFTSAQPAYVYLLGTDSKRSPVVQLFPDESRNISALLDFTSEVKVSIPDESQYIQMDETPGEDYLCVIYSKEPLDMARIKNSVQGSGKSFVKAVKEALAGRIVNEEEVAFDKNKISFSAASAKRTAVPVFIGFKHQ